MNSALPFSRLLYNGATKRRGIVPIGRTAVSKTDGWGFESLCPCHFGLSTHSATDKGESRA